MEERSALRKSWPYLVVTLVSIAVFSNSLWGAFCFDDAFALLYNGDVHHQENRFIDIFKHDFWGHDITKPDSHKSYRPLTTISFRLNYLTFIFFGGNETRPAHLSEDHNGSTWQPESFLVGLHLVNVILHAGVSCYVYKFAFDLYALLMPQLTDAPGAQPPVSALWNQISALLAGLLFATHPVHVDAVASIVGRAEMLSAILCIIAFDLWRHQKSWRKSFGAIVLVYASVLCKEITFATYGAFFVWDILYYCNLSIKHVKLQSSPAQQPNEAHTNGGDPPTAPQSASQNGTTDSLPSNANSDMLLPRDLLRAKTAAAGDRHDERGANRQRNQHNPNAPHHRHHHHHHNGHGTGENGNHLSASAPVVIQPSPRGPSCLRPLLLLLERRLRSLRVTFSKSLPTWLPMWFHEFLDHTLFSVHWIFRTALTALAFSLYLHMRRMLMGDSIIVQNYRRVENPLAFIEDKLELAMSGAYLHANYLWILLYPVHLSCDWSFNCIPLITSPFDYRNLLTLAAYLLVIVPALWSIVGIFQGNRRSMPILFCIFWGLLFFTPASNLFFFVGTMLAERVLYLPSVTFCILIPVAIERILSFLPARTRLQVVAAICFVLIAGYTHKTWMRNYDWTDNQALFESAELVCPESAKVHFNLGILRTQQKNWSKAAFHFNKTREIEPNYCEVDYRRAHMYFGEGNYHNSIEALKRGLDCIYTRADSALMLKKIFEALVNADPANAQFYISSWNAIVKYLEPLLKEDLEGKRPIRQG